MSTEQNQPDNEIPPFPTPKNGQSYVPEEEEKKSGGGGSWLSLVISLFLIIRGAMWLNDGVAIWGMILIAVGLGGGIWKIIDMNR